MEEKRATLIKERLARYIQGLYLRKEVDMLHQAAKSEEGRGMLEDEMDWVWKESPACPPSVFQERIYRKEAQKLLRKIGKEEKRFSFAVFLKYAAVIALLAILGFGTKHFWGNYPFPSVQEQAPLYMDVQVKHGQHQKVVLPDGTLVYLNAGTSMRYPAAFTGDTRRVELKGEAFFEVTKDERKPFIVRTVHTEVKVLGTSFNVKSYEEDELVTVSVRTGKVEVKMPESTVRLLPDEQLIVNTANGEMQKKDEDARKVTAWLQGGLYFNGTPIRNVVHELERMYDCEIGFDTAFVFDEYIYGEHDNHSLESVLNAIRYSTGIRYKKEGNRILLYK